MNWDEARAYHEDRISLPKSSDGFHQHANGGGWVSDKASVDAKSYIGERAIVLGGTIKGGTIEGGTIEGGTIWGGTIQRTPILIFGSQYWIGFSRPGYIASGCIEKPAEWWLEHVERCAEEHGYSETEQKEYRLHVEHIVAWMKLHGLDVAESGDHQ